MATPEYDPELTTKQDDSTSGTAAELDDSTLLERLRVGDERAYNTIYLTYVNRLIRLAYSYVGSTTVAEDVVADTFVHLWERRAQVVPHFGLKAYLFAAVHNRARKVLRSDQRHTRMVDRMYVDESDDLTGVEMAMDAATLDTALRRAIRALPEERRRLVALRWYEGLTVPQIAHILGVSVGAVEQRLLRTLNALRKLLDASL